MNNDHGKKKYVNYNIDSYYKKKYKQTVLKKFALDRQLEEYGKGKMNRIFYNLNSRICRTFKKYNLTLDMTYLEILGCSLEFLEQHIQKQFTNGMTFDNYGEWEIDHILPVSSFNFDNRENIFKCFGYNNLQPLWKTENRHKSAKIYVNQ